MPKTTANGVSLAYEILGVEGPSVVLTPAGPGPGGVAYVKETNLLLAEQLASLGCRVVVWDRRNSGESSIRFEGEPGEWEFFADDLHALLRELGMSPSYSGGSSGGYLTSLLLTHRYPEDVKGLLLISPMPGDPEIWKQVADSRYFQPTDEADRRGMKGVIDNSVWGKVADQNSTNREILLSISPEEFTAVMRRWGI